MFWGRSVIALNINHSFSVNRYSKTFMVWVIFKIQQSFFFFFFFHSLQGNKDSGIHAGNFCFWNPEYWALTSRIPLKKESRTICGKSISNGIDGFHAHPCNHWRVQFTQVLNGYANLEGQKESVYITKGLNPTWFAWNTIVGAISLF